MKKATEGNIVFHFHRGIAPKDIDRLRRLRYGRELYAKRMTCKQASV